MKSYNDTGYFRPIHSARKRSREVFLCVFGQLCVFVQFHTKGCLLSARMRGYICDLRYIVHSYLADSAHCKMFQFTTLRLTESYLTRKLKRFHTPDLKNLGESCYLSVDIGVFTSYSAVKKNSDTDFLCFCVCVVLKCFRNENKI